MMKLAVEDDKDTSCNGNGIENDQIKKMISSEPPKVSSNGDVHNDDSRSNSESLNGSGDLLVEDPNVRNSSEDILFQNGNKPDDTRSWSSNSSNFPPHDIDEELSDEMTLRLSDDEDESESTENRKDSTSHASPLLPIADQNTLSDKNQSIELVKEDEIIDDKSSIKLVKEDEIIDKSSIELVKEDEIIDKSSIELVKEDEIIDKSSIELVKEDEIIDDKSSIELVKEDEIIDKSSTEDASQSNTEQNSSKNISTEENTNETDEINKSPELESLMSEIMPEIPNDKIDIDNDKSVTELREEMEELLNDEDAEDKVQIDEKNDSIDIKEEFISDVDLNSSGSTLNEESSCELNKKTEREYPAAINEEKLDIPEKDDNSEETTKTNENEEIKETNDIINNQENEEKTKEGESVNEAQMETEDISENVSKLDENNEEPNIESSELNKDVPLVSTENSDVATTTDETVEEKSDSVSENSNNDKLETNAEETLNVNLKDNSKECEDNNKSNDNDETRVISEPMVIENSSEKVDNLNSSTNVNNILPSDSEPMEVDSNNDVEKLTEVTKNTIIEEPTKENPSTKINEDKISDSLVDNKDKQLTEIEEIKSEPEVKMNNKEEDKKEIKEDDCSSKSLKRSLETDDNEIEAKKPKIIIKKQEKREYIPMNCLRDFMVTNGIKTITLEEVEDFCVQKMCEAVNQASKVGHLNRLAKQQEKVIESLRTKYNALKKQVGDISIVQNKMLQEVRSAKELGISPNIMPVKITRSVGLQVTLQPLNRMRTAPTEQIVTAAAPVQKRKVQRISLPNKLPSAQTPVTPITPAKPISATIPKPPNVIPTPNKVVKTLLPRTYSGPDANKDVSSSTNSLLGTYLTTSTPKATPMPSVVRKPITPTNAVSSTAAATTTPTANSTKVIDLTDEDDTAKVAPAPAIPPTPAGIRVVAPHQLQNATSTAVTSQMQRVTYLVSPGQQGQVLLATTTAPTRPGGPRSTIMFKPVQQGQVPNGQRLNFVRPNSTGGGTVTVLPATSTASIRPGQQIRFQTSGTTVNSLRPQMISSTRITPTARHPAPLPGPPAVQPSQPTWKAMPPKPSLKISRVGDGIVLSWKMFNKDMSLYEDIASYQLYAYQETNALPSTEMWRKVGDVKALALPMACTLTQFTDGNKYHFAVRAVDVKSRVGPFSQPEQIALP